MNATNRIQIFCASSTSFYLLSNAPLCVGGFDKFSTIHLQLPVGIKQTAIVNWTLEMGIYLLQCPSALSV